ncbi:MAG: hypothetical protein FWE83_00190 [Oscillospiraceae bacterium]|nr:hypothetical protein [Oscillospiraceae bacterium]
MSLNSIEMKFSRLMRFEKHKILSITILTVCSLIVALSMERVYSVGRTYIFGTIRGFLAGTGNLILYPEVSMMTVYRAAILFFIVFFLLLHIIVKIKVFYEIVFKYRYAIAVVVLLILVVNKIHFSSVAMYDYHIQPGYGSELREPVFGWARPIRSDEWLVSTPIQLSAQFPPDPYGQINHVARGTATENMPNGMAIGLATLAFPMNIFYLFGAEYGVSARWVGMLILTFMVTFEFAYIISGKNRLLGVVGACLITFSPFFQWWSYVIFITAGMGALVCYYYFLNSDALIKRVLFAFGIVVFMSQFIVSLYPAWQVPAGYLYLGFAVWLTVTNWESVKNFNKIDYAIIGVALILVVSVVATYFHGSREYIAGISNTIYPGARQDSGGTLDISNTINKMMNGGVYSPISSRRGFIYTNICEFGGMFTLFPLPVLFILFIMIRRRVFDLLSIILIAFTIIMGSYVFIGWPDWLASVTLMSNSVSGRAMDVMLFAQVFLLIRAMSRFKAVPGIDETGNENTGNENTGKNIKKEAVLLGGSIAVAALLTYIVISFSRVTFTTPLGNPFIAFTFIGFVLVVYTIFDCQRLQVVFKAACLYMIIISTATLMMVHPVMRGLDAIYSKPLSIKVQELAQDTNDKWLSLHGIVGSSFLIANGASTISSTNFYPNLDLWYMLDPDRQYEYAYNRYAVITVGLTTENTSFELFHTDHLHIHFSVNDLEAAGVKYIHSPGPLDNHNNIIFTLLYNEGGARIYSVGY